MKASRIAVLAFLALCLLALPAQAYHEPKDMELLATYKVAGAGNDIAWSPDGKCLALTNGSNITVIDPIDGEVLFTLAPANGSVRGLQWSPDGSRLAFSAGPLPYVAIRNATGSAGQAGAATFPAFHFALSPNGTWIATDWGEADPYVVRIYNSVTGDIVQSIPTFGSSVDSLVWSPDGLGLAAILDSIEIRLWNVTNDTSIYYPPFGWHGTITSLCWSPDGRFLLVGVNDSQGPFNVRLLATTYNFTDTGGLSHTLYNHSTTNCVAWSPDGTMATGQEDGSIFLTGFDDPVPEGYPSWWDVHAIGYPAGPVTSLDWSSDGKLLVAASTDGTVRIWGPPGSLPAKPRLAITAAADRMTVAGGETVNLTVRLLDGNSAPVGGATVSMLSPSGGALSAVTDAGQGNYTATFKTPAVKSNTTITLAFSASKKGYSAASASLQLLVLPPSAAGRSAEPAVHTDNDNAAALVIAGSAVLMVAAALAATEAGKYSGMALFFPLFTRMKKTAVLDNFSRGQLHGYIAANPGVHMNAIRDRFGLSNGEVAYHLRVLEREGYVSSMNDGLRRRFYPGESAGPKERTQELSVVQNLLISIMEKSPGISGRELARLAGTSPQVVNYHLKKLWRLDLITMDRDGRVVRCFVRPEKLGLFKRAEARTEALPEESPFRDTA